MIPSQRGAAAPSVVVDASAMLEVLTSQPGHERLIDAMTHLPALHAPALLDLELLSTAHRLERANRLTAEQQRRFLLDLGEFQIERHLLPPLMNRVWSLRDWLRIADGYYVALAETLEVPLLTTDGRLARAVSERGLVEVVDVDGR